MPKNKFASIEEFGGLEEWVISKGYNYDDLIKRFELKEPDTIIARAIGVSRVTIKSWREIYMKERSKK